MRRQPAEIGVDETTAVPKILAKLLRAPVGTTAGRCKRLGKGLVDDGRLLLYILGRPPTFVIRIVPNPIEPGEQLGSARITRDAEGG